MTAMAEPALAPATIEPTGERLRRGARRVERLADESGAAAAPWRDWGLLERWREAGVISAAQLAAAQDFAAVFRLAQLDPLRASDPARDRVSGTARVEVGVRAERARTRLRDLLSGLSALESGAVWHVVGLELSLRSWCWIRQPALSWRDGQRHLIAGLALIAETISAEQRSKSVSNAGVRAWHSEPAHTSAHWRAEFRA